jgi:carboxylesterase type B
MDGCDFEQKHLIQCSIGGPETPPPMSGTECLNLNITVPDTVSAEKVSGLPVMVFVHGGGFIMGANYYPQYDAARLVRLSVEVGMPIVAVNIK